MSLISLYEGDSDTSDGVNTKPVVGGLYGAPRAFQELKIASTE
ncbi:MAG: hypothetical protein WA580_01640 [Acidimicrobiales bacterium]